MVFPYSFIVEIVSRNGFRRSTRRGNLALNRECDQCFRPPSFLKISSIG